MRTIPVLGLLLLLAAGAFGQPNFRSSSHMTLCFQWRTP